MLPMKSDGLLKHVLIVFTAAVVFYIACFSWIEHRREFKGPWEITFQINGSNAPSLLIAEPALKISGKISFPKEKIAATNLPQTIRFDQPITNVPFGQMVYQDPTFLPGAVTLNLFRHEIEFLPRVLVIDKKEYPWQTAGAISITEPGQIDSKILKQTR